MNGEHLGLLSVAIIWLAGAILVSKWRGSHAMSFSQHAASDRRAFWFFAIAQTISGFMFALFILEWFVPQFALPMWYAVLCALTIGLQLLAAWIPEVNVVPRRVHRIIAYAMAYMMLPVAWGAVILPQLDFTARIIGGVFAATMVGLVLAVLVFKIPNLTQRYLLYQGAYIACFQLAMLSVAYLG